MDKAQIVLGFLKKRVLPNENRKKPMLDALPVFAPIATSVLFILIFLVFLLVNGIWRLDELVREENIGVFSGLDTQNFMLSKTVLNEARGGVREDHFVKTNNFLKIFIYFRKRWEAKNVGVSQENLKFSYSLDLYRKDTLGKPYDVIKNDVTADLNCGVSASHDGKDLDCDGILLYFSETVPVYRYVLNLKLVSDLYSYPILNDTVSIGWRCDGSVWLTVEIVFSWLIWVGTVLAFVAWMMVMCTVNGFNNWSLEQRMVKILFILAILYINPFYWIDDVYDSSWVTYVFKFGDAVVMCSFVVWMWFCIHMFTHWIGQPNAKKNIVIWVYSIVLGILFWVFLFVIILSWRYTRTFQVFFQSIGYAMIITNCFLFPFHLIRLVVLLTKQQIEETFDTIKRMIFLFGISLPTVFGVFLMLVVKPWDDQLNTWFYEMLMLLILFLMAIQFLPSWKKIDRRDEGLLKGGRLYGGGSSGYTDATETEGIIATTTDTSGDHAIQEPMVETGMGMVEQDL